MVIAAIALLVFYGTPFVERKYNDSLTLRAMQIANTIASFAADAQAARNLSIEQLIQSQRLKRYPIRRLYKSALGM